jgi:D-beta-D-heptose 7-phosphate kinase / D-beta-D-heptose 1-phosphate adenosyltransferase
MVDFEKSLALISAETVLCVGDLMLDEFVYGEVERISPEAPAPVLAVSRSELVIGGAGNVARNIAALGARCIFVGVVGGDDASRRLTAELRSDPSIEVCAWPSIRRGLPPEKYDSCRSIFQLICCGQIGSGQ